MNQIPCCDWLPRQARWSDLARLGLRALSRKKNFSEAGSSKFCFVICPLKILFHGSKRFRVVSVSMQLENKETACVNENETKKTKMLMSFMNLFCNRNRQTQKLKHKVT